MSYNLLTNLIFLISILGIIVLVLRRLPQAVEGADESDALASEPLQSLQEKGLPAKAVSRSVQYIKMGAGKLWHFILDAKGMKHNPKVSYNLKKIMQTHTEPDVKKATVRNEQYYIDMIKRHPKDLDIYDQLGQFYIEQRKYFDASNVYEYLINHNPSNSGFFAKLGLSKLYLQEYDGAATAFKKAVNIDSSHPGRFYNLALSYQGMKNWREAATALRKAVELEPGNQKYNDLLFEVESKAKKSVPVENIHKTR